MGSLLKLEENIDLPCPNMAEVKSLMSTFLLGVIRY